MTVEKQDIKIISCNLRQDHFPYYLIEYQAKNHLSYQKGDNIWIIDTENMQSIVTVRSVKDYTAEIYMSKQYENTIIGNIKVWLLFSPITSIEGASEIMKVTEVFPPCHYEKIVSFIERENEISLQIFLEMDNRTMELCLSNIEENRLVDYEDENIILQLDFSYCDNGIKIDIDSITGLSGTVVCKKITAQWI